MLSDQIKALQDLSERYDVEVEIFQDQGKVVLSGPKDEISDASDTVHKILRDADHHVQNKLQAKLISDYVQWYYIDTDDKKELIDYPDHINLVIEKAYRNKDKEVKFSDTAGVEYIINFNNMEEYPSDDKSDVTTVTRRDKIESKTNNSYFCSELRYPTPIAPCFCYCKQNKIKLTFSYIKPTNLHIMLRVAYLDFIKF